MLGRHPKRKKKEYLKKKKKRNTSGYMPGWLSRVEGGGI